MNQDTLLNFLLVLLFVLVGGLFAATELALVSLRESQTNQIANQGPRGAKVAALARNPNRFLSAVQIGVTVAGFFSAAYGASAIAPDLVPTLVSWGLPESVANTVSLVGMTLLIAYLSLVFGELVPKRIALQRSAGLSLAVAPALDRFATAMRPVIWLLSKSTDGVVRLLGGDPSARSEHMSDEELRDLVAAHEGLGEDERRIVSEVFEVGERSLSEVMRSRTEVDFLRGATSVADAIRLAREMPHSRYPVTGRSVDDIIGFVHVRDLFDPAVSGNTTAVAELSREIPALPATKKVLPTLSRMRREGVHIAVVVDEYGGTAGIVTLEDLVEELVGDIRDEYDTEEADSELPRPGEVVEVDGRLIIEEFRERTSVELPDGSYETVAGYFISEFGQLPRVGDKVFIDEHELKVTEVDGRRVSRLQFTPAAPPGEDADGEDTGTEGTSAGA